MQYVATVTQEGKQWLAEFPDAPGCQTFASNRRALAKAAQEALIGWLEAHLLSGQVPPRPGFADTTSSGLRVDVPARLAVALRLRWARTEAKLTQAELAKRSGLAQQMIARLERPTSNPTVETLAKVAAALGTTLELEMRPVAEA